MVNTVLVTGGGGFIGTWVLKELLSRGITPVVIDNHQAPGRWQTVLGSASGQVQVSTASLLRPEELQATLEDFSVTHVIHLAALLTPACQQDPWLGCQVNILGSAAVFEAARKSGGVQSISYASSYAVYGPEADADHSVSNQPPTFYGAFKQSVDLIAEQYWRHFQLPSVAVRPHVVYGPERDQGLTAGPSLAARSAALGQGFTIGYRGTVGYDYVEDVARAFVQGALECPRSATVVDLPGEQVTTEEFARKIEMIVPGVRGKIHVEGPQIPSNIPTQPRYISKLFPDWTATPLLEGIRKTVAFYRHND